MRLADAIADTTPLTLKPGKVDRLIDKIEHDDEREQFVAMMHEPMVKWSHKRLARILSNVAGEYISDTTIGEWRRDRGVS